MAVYEISSVYRKNGVAGDNRFKGFFVLNEENQEIRGYIETLDTAMRPEKRYVYGIYDKAKDILAYLQLSDKRDLKPKMFMFCNTRKSGTWSFYDSDMCTFFAFGRADGSAEVSIKEITVPADAERISKIAFSTFTECIDLFTNIPLIYKGVRPYMNLGIK